MAENEPPAPAYLEILQELDDILSAVHRLEFQVVRFLRESGTTWEEIGDELGVSRQAARSRFMTPRTRRRTALPTPENGPDQWS